MNNSHTKVGWISEKITFWPPQTPVTLSPTPGACPGNRMKIPSDIFHIFHLWEDTKSLVKNLWNWLCNWHLMIFDLLAPPQGPRGSAKRWCRCTPQSCEHLTHQILLGFVQWFRRRYRYRRTDGRTEAIAISRWKQNGKGIRSRRWVRKIYNVPACQSTWSLSNPLMSECWFRCFRLFFQVWLYVTVVICLEALLWKNSHAALTCPNVNITSGKFPRQKKSRRLTSA